MLGPGRGFRQSLAHDLLAEARTEFGALGDGEQGLGGKHAVERMLPAHERLDADDAVRRDVDLRLVEDVEELPFRGDAEIGLERRETLGIVVVLRDEDLEAVRIELLGAGEGGTGALEEYVRGGHFGVARGDAHAAGQVNDATADDERLLERLADPLREEKLLVEHDRAGEDDSEVRAEEP